MAELLVMAVDRVNADVYSDCMCYKRGDVVVAKPNGWTWGVKETDGTTFLVLQVPDLPLAEAETFCAQERQSDPRQPSRTLQRRAFKLDLDQLPLTPTADQIRAARVAKAPIADPAILGLRPGVLG